ncbi:MAG: basic amino acid/polyamine antiporter, family [Thermoleophilaceae bacterium]|nr:basic amino acid/polyamine antiporter, family [Thermoleophilaceae bacterium]
MKVPRPSEAMRIVRPRHEGRAGIEDRVSRAFGQPALAALGISALGSAIFFTLGVVADDARGLTPVVYAIAGLFFVLTAMTYIEGNSMHPERGGASTFARYAFDELVAFVAGWAFILDYLIVMALGAYCISHYLAAFWGHANDAEFELLVAAAAVVWVAWQNIRGTPATRYQTVLRLAVINIVLSAVIVLFGLATEWRPTEVVNSIHLGSSPRWQDLFFALGVATAATTGVEAASGLAGDVRVGSRGLRKLVVSGAAVATLLFVGMSIVATVVGPIDLFHSNEGQSAPVLTIVTQYDPSWVMHVLRYAVGATGALVLLQAVNGSMLGLSRLAYSLATNRQIPSLLGRLHPQRSTPYVAVSLASVIVIGIAATRDVRFMAGTFAFGSLLAFTIAHVSVIALRFREPALRRPFQIPLSVKVGGGMLPLPAVLAAVMAAAGWISVLILHSGARVVGSLWMVFGVTLYVIYRRGQDKPLRKRFTIPARALQDITEVEYGSILVPVFGGELDDDIVGTAGRLASDEGEEGEGGAVIEALYVVEVPMSLPLDARVPDEKIAAAKKAVARAKEVGEEYEGVVVATAMVRARSIGQAIVSEAKRRGVEAIVLGAEEPTRTRGGTLLGGRSGPRDKGLGEMTRYVLEKAPCRVILTAAPAGEEGERAGVAP